MSLLASSHIFSSLSSPRLISCYLCALRLISSRRISPRRMSSHLFSSLGISSCLWKSPFSRDFFILFCAGAMTVPPQPKGSHPPRSFFILDILPTWCHDSSLPPSLKGHMPPEVFYTWYNIYIYFPYGATIVASHQNQRLVSLSEVSLGLKFFFCDTMIAPPHLKGRIPLHKGSLGRRWCFFWGADDSTSGESLGAQMMFF